MTGSVEPPSDATTGTWRDHFPDGDLWVFGYGSLIWKPPPHIGEQASLESPSSSAVWGAAYHIPASHAEEVHAYLDDREIDGYTVHYTAFHPVSSPDSNSNSEQLKPHICMVYIGLPSNSQFLNNPSLREPSSVAQVISTSRGKSGENTEYLYLLEEALEGLGLGSADGHVTELVKRVKNIEAGRAEEAARLAAGEIDAKGVLINKGTDTPEEFEKD
ncbi:hypothetical protein FQN54_002494 [Arachnomyces sp. PD_36]|nr:hypothetical protein FQN54_002494 [Arachnomyces sp. PD_36]